MAECPAINASPLILLTKGGLLELLQLISEEVIVPVMHQALSLVGE